VKRQDAKSAVVDPPSDAVLDQQNVEINRQSQLETRKIQIGGELASWTGKIFSTAFKSTPVNPPATCWFV
jgi:hypothetical protein